MRDPIKSILGARGSGSVSYDTHKPYGPHTPYPANPEGQYGAFETSSELSWSPANDLVPVRALDFQSRPYAYNSAPLWPQPHPQKADTHSAYMRTALKKVEESKACHHPNCPSQDDDVLWEEYPDWIVQWEFWSKRYSKLVM